MNSITPPQAGRMIRRPEVLHITGLTDSALDREIRAGRFPRPIKLSPDPRSRAVGWLERWAYEWNAKRVADAQQAAA